MEGDKNSPTIIESLGRVLEYLYKDELKDYEATESEEEKSKHIFIHIKNLAEQFNL